ncbi:MAG: hypothetical protein HY817_00125 [Candidatus Abawacabacteria bacterium]|nr:hypothetical protein [Candidatus Abawacabacteria bacterium]
MNPTVPSNDAVQLEDFPIPQDLKELKADDRAAVVQAIEDGCRAARLCMELLFKTGGTTKRITWGSVLFMADNSPAELGQLGLPKVQKGVAAIVDQAMMERIAYRRAHDHWLSRV